MNKVTGFFSVLYDFVFPPLSVCDYCGARKKTAQRDCQACQETWQSLKVMGKRNKGYACYYYDDVVKTAVRQYKYGRQEDLAEKMADDVAHLIQSLGLDTAYISYIPLHRSKRKKRGFDQAQRLAELVAARMDKQALCTLKRIKRTKTQATLTPEIRKQNVKNAFICDMSTKIDKKSAIILLDDVYTTGATMAAAKEALNKAGYKNVNCMTFATSLVNKT